MSRFGSIVLLLVATVALATLPPGYMGDVLHIVFDGSGTWNEQLGSGPATASVRWHDEWDVTIPDLLMTFSQGGITGANDATMVSGSSTFPNPACSGPLVLNRSHGTPTPPGPWLGWFTSTYQYPQKKTVELWAEAYGGSDYRLCDGIYLPGVGPFGPAMFGGETIGFELADTFAPFEVDLSEWVGKPVHEKQIGVSFPSTTVSQGSDMATAAWAGTITLSNLKGGSGGSSGGVSAGDKQKARDDANVQFEWLLIDCGIGGGATVFSGGPPAVTGTMQALAEVDCLFDVLTLIADSIVANDPPDADFRRIATAAASSRPALSLPSCRALAGNDRRVCTKLERAAHRLATRVKRVKDVATALATTANRLSGALQASAATAAKKQKRAFAKLRKKLDAALRARGTAGKAVAQVLRAANVSGQLNEAETAQAIDVALKDLSQQGLSESAARSLVGSAASPRAIDALAVLATP